MAIQEMGLAAYLLDIALSLFAEVVGDIIIVVVLLGDPEYLLDIDKDGVAKR
jgi:hypothetical protein